MSRKIPLFSVQQHDCVGGVQIVRPLYLELVFEGVLKCNDRNTDISAIDVSIEFADKKSMFEPQRIYLQDVATNGVETKNYKFLAPRVLLYAPAYCADLNTAPGKLFSHGKQPELRFQIFKYNFADSLIQGAEFGSFSVSRHLGRVPLSLHRLTRRISDRSLQPEMHMDKDITLDFQLDPLISNDHEGHILISVHKVTIKRLADATMVCRKLLENNKHSLEQFPVKELGAIAAFPAEQKEGQPIDDYLEHIFFSPTEAESYPDGCCSTGRSSNNHASVASFLRERNDIPYRYFEGCIRHDKSVEPSERMRCWAVYMAFFYSRQQADFEVLEALLLLTLCLEAVDLVDFTRRPHLYVRVLPRFLCSFTFISHYTNDEDGDQWMPLRAHPDPEMASGDCEDHALEVSLLYFDLVNASRSDKVGEGTILTDAVCALKKIAELYCPFLVDCVAHPDSQKSKRSLHNYVQLQRWDVVCELLDGQCESTQREILMQHADGCLSNVKEEELASFPRVLFIEATHSLSASTAFDKFYLERSERDTVIMETDIPFLFMSKRGATAVYETLLFAYAPILYELLRISFVTFNVRKADGGVDLFGGARENIRLAGCCGIAFEKWVKKSRKNGQPEHTPFAMVPEYDPTIPPGSPQLRDLFSPLPRLEAPFPRQREQWLREVEEICEREKQRISLEEKEGEFHVTRCLLKERDTLVLSDTAKSRISFSDPVTLFSLHGDPLLVSIASIPIRKPYSS